MSSEFTLSQGAGQKLEFAINRTSGTSEHVEWLSTSDNFKKVIDLASGTHKVVPADAIVTMPSLLRLIGTVQTIAMDEFIVAEKFVVGCRGEVPIRYFGRNFKANFLGKVERDVPAATLRQHELARNSRDESIRNELGPDKEEVLLGQFHQFLMSADRTKWYVAYIKDSKGTLWAVDAHWNGGGWNVGADSVGGPRDWRAGGVLVSR